MQPSQTNNHFRKKPVVVEAWQWLPDNLEAAGRVVGWLLAAGADINHFGTGEGGAVPLNIVTLEGIMRAEAGDWIIRGVKGEFYPCKPDIFEATYDPA
jgi:hypothetical protein